MNNDLSAPRRRLRTATPAVAPRPLPITLALVAAGLMGCASPVPRSAGALPQVESKSLQALREQVLQEQRKLTEQQNLLQEELRRAAKPVPTPQPSAAPPVDPFDLHTVSITLSGASIGQALLVFADQAGMNLLVDPDVARLGLRADMHLKNVSLRDAFDEVMRTFDVHGEINGRTLRVSLRQSRMLPLDFLNVQGQLNLSSGGNVFGGSTGGGGGSAGSSAIVGNLTLTGSGGDKSDPYADIEAAVRSILAPRSAEATASVGPPAGAQPAAGGAGAPAAAAPQGQGQGQARAAGGASPEAGDTYTLNRASGTLYVSARPSKLRAIEQFVGQVRRTLDRQVHIEAQLIDVQLSDQFEFGVDWQLLRSRVATVYGSPPAGVGGSTFVLPNAGNALGARPVTLPGLSLGNTAGPALGVLAQSGGFGVVVNALRAFGNIKVLSNPNVQVRNGTPALLSIGSSVRYVARSSTTQTTPGGGATTTSSDVQTDALFSGVMVGVLPHIRADRRVELLVYPMQSDVDPKSLQLVDITPTSRVTLPVVNYKGVNTTLVVGDGEVAVIGGLIDQRYSQGDRGAPGVSDVPVLGKLFGNDTRSHSSRELVVVLRVRVL